MRFDLLPAPLLALLVAPVVEGFYLPGITPNNYKKDDRVPLHVNRLTPSQSGRNPQVRSAFSYDYYNDNFHFCSPKDGPEPVSESLGSILFGDRIQTSVFRLDMKRNVTCRALCEQSTDFSPEHAQFVNSRIRESYIQNWLVDGLPAAQNFRDPTTGTEYYNPGFLLGDVDQDTGLPHFHNHFDLFIDYHEVRSGLYRVVGFLVEPSSRRDSKRIGEANWMNADCGDESNPLILDETEDTKKVFWTYSVYWRESPVTFATRWDKYLHVFDPKIHWFSLVNSTIIVVFLIGMVSTVLTRTLKKDIARYNRLDQLGLDDLNGTTVEDGVQEDSGWKLVHGDVFRAPKYGLILSVLVGNGAQLFAMAGFTIAFAAVGFLSPSNRGSLATVMILLHTFLASIGGYASARVYKSFNGTKWKMLFILTPTVIPVLVFGTFFLLNLFVWAKHSSGAVPLPTMLVVIGIWFVISVPLSIAGSWFGFRQSLPEPPTRTNQIPRQIPPSQGYLRLVPSLLLVGVLPFGAIFVELYFIMSSLWSNRIYYMFGFLFLSFGLLVVTSAAVTLLMIYFLLCAENYHWQWRAFASSGASAGYVLAYSLLYWARMMKFSTFVGALIYLSYSTMISLLWFLLSGSIGFFASWVFVHRIYGSLKVD